MAARQKDVKTFFKKLRKRYSNDPAVLSRDRKILEHLVFAIFLENATFAQARAAFIELQRYFIDWNEIRVSTANEIASVIGNVPDPVRAGERLRRLLQWIFDNTYKFELEDYRAKGREEVLEFLKTVPFSTPFMNDYAVFFGFGGSNIPLDENCFRVLRLLGYVSVVDGKEVAPCLDGSFKENEAREFFFALHEFAFELSQENTKKEAMKFLSAFDASVSKRSDKPQVEPSFPTDPLEIARLLSKREPRQKNSMPSSSEMLESEMDDDYDEKRDDGLFDDYDSDSSEIDEKDAARNGASEEAFITSRSTSYIDNRPSAKEKTKKRLLDLEAASREKADSPDSTSTEKTTSSKASKSKSKAVVEAKIETVAEKVPEIGPSKGKKKDKAAADDVKTKRIAKEKEMLPLEEAVAVKKGTKEAKKKVSKVVEKTSKKVEAATKTESAKKTKTSVKKSKTSADEKSSSVSSKAVSGKSSKVSVSSSKKVKKPVVEDEVVSTRGKKTKKEEKQENSKVSSSVRSKGKSSVVADKKTVKSVSRGRKAASEPPDKSNVDAGKKTAKRSIVGAKGQKKSKGKK